MKTGGNNRIVHELSGRLRIRCSQFSSRDFNPAYLEAVLENINGVENARINTWASCIVVCYDGSFSTKEAVITNLESIPVESCRPGGRPDLINPITLVSLGIFTLVSRFLPRPLSLGISLLVALPTLVRGIVILFTKGIKVDVLDGAVVGFSLMRRDYFTSNAVVFLLTLGEYLEQLSEDKTTNMLRSLLRPQVEKVWVEKEGLEISMAVTDVMIGDIVVCGPGEMIPIDGQVVSGDALLNQSSITGESVPIHVEPGNDVLSGSLVEEGKIKIEARQVGSDTGMARINSFLENSLRSRSPSQKNSEELADKLVPLTFGLGLGLFVLTRDVSRAASVLTVDYSCSIKLSNPVAVKSAMYTAARNGVLLKGSQSMDSLAAVDTIVFDKTGTLTSGVLQVVDVIPVNLLDENELLALAAGAEEHYTHPVAKAVVKEAQHRGLELPTIGQVDFIVAHGVSAYVDGERVLVGSRHFIEDDERIDCSEADELINDLHSQGKSLLFVAGNKKLAGIIALRDDVRSEAPAVLKELKCLGMKRIVVLTGDHCDTARALVKELSEVDEVYWELKPEEKAKIVTRLQQEGSKIAFAGDGVNDAPALVTAEVGICMPGGADLARESAEVILLRDDLRTLVTARQIAMKAQQTIKNGFNATVGFNTLFLILASLGRISPVTAALLHNTNTIGILGYSALAGLQYNSTEYEKNADFAE